MNNKHKNDKLKAKFFSTFYNERIYEENDDVIATIEEAQRKTNLSLDQVSELFEEVMNRKWDGLSKTGDGSVIAFFKINATKLFEITQSMMHKETA